MVARVFNILLLALVAASVAAFAPQSNNAFLAKQSARTVPTTPFSRDLVTAQLKIKVDPDEVQSSNNLGNAKMAAYGGSIAIAIALPFFFLIWSALK